MTSGGLATQQQILRPVLEQNLFNVLKHGKYIDGPEVQRLERELAIYIGCKHCITIINGFEAMLIALMAVGVRAGDEVVTSPFASGSTAQAIMLLGAKPVFADISSRTYNINPDLIESVINHKTRAIIPINLFGQCADVFTINTVANKYYLPVIEDASDSFGATYHERYSCTLSAIGCINFSPTALFSTYGEGGACFTDDDQLAELIHQLRSLGQTEKYYCQSNGLSSRMNTLQASILLGKLPHFAKEIEKRVNIANTYNNLLEGKAKTPIIESHNTSVYAQYVIQVDNRDRIRNSLQDQGIPTEIHYPFPLHLQPAFAYLHKEKGSFPIAESVAKRVLSLPLHPYLTDEEVSRVVDTLGEILS
ncbi:MAG: aminotransferase DegT [Beggiatoa sp. IS2]|nr:MAG: aminotransferase DegT [Beggiatoa sp. IS2]